MTATGKIEPVTTKQTRKLMSKKLDEECTHEAWESGVGGSRRCADCKVYLPKETTSEPEARAEELKALTLLEKSVADLRAQFENPKAFAHHVEEAAQTVETDIRWFRKVLYRSRFGPNQ